MPINSRRVEVKLNPLDDSKFNAAFEPTGIAHPIHGNVEAFSPIDNAGALEIVQDWQTQQDLAARNEQLQEYVRQGWLSAAAMLEASYGGSPLVFNMRDNQGNSYQEIHPRPPQGENFVLNSVGMIMDNDLTAMAMREGMELGSAPQDVLLTAYLQRIEGFAWANSAEAIDYIWDARQAIQRGEIVTNNPIIHPEIEKQVTHRFFREDVNAPTVDDDGDLSVEQIEQLAKAFVGKVSVEELFADRPALEAIKDHIYLTRGSNSFDSRNELSSKPIVGRVGLHPRIETAAAPMPLSQGAIEYLSSMARLHGLAVVPRNYQLADIDARIDFTKRLMDDLDSRDIPTLDEERKAKAKTLWKSNISVAIGINDDEINSIDRFLNETDVRSFRLYTVATDRRMQEKSRLAIQKIKAWNDAHPTDKVEFFVGQMTHEDQLGPNRDPYPDDADAARDDQAFYDFFGGLTEEELEQISGFYFGNGGGSMCSTASTGMGVNTLTLLYRFRNDPRFKKMSFIVEGGITLKEFPLPNYGAHAESLASQAMAIESPGGADVMLVGKNKPEYSFQHPKMGKPICGEASELASTVEERMDGWTGMPKQTEGQKGIKHLSPDMPSMVQIVRERLKYLSQVMVKLGIKNIDQLHALGTFQTAASMEAIFGQDWMKQRDMCRVNQNQITMIAAKIRESLKVPQPRVTDQELLRYAGIDPDHKGFWYIIPTQMRLASAAALLEGSPHGAGVTTLR